MPKILFICDGNICRSPAAAAFLRSYYGGQVRSAGISAATGRPMMQLMQQVLAAQGLPTEHASQKISAENLTWADLILTMTRPQKFILISMVPAIANRVYTLQEYIGHPHGDIAVPNNETLQAYEQCARSIQQSCCLLHQKLSDATMAEP